MDIKGNATNTSNSDFEHIKAWENNTNLDYYLSEEHWNFHVNQMLYKNLLVFHEGKEVGAFLDVNGPDFGDPIKDYTSLYGNMFNEAYRLCKSILTIPVPETKVAQFATQSATWKFRNLKDKKGKPIQFEIAPNVTDLIESYHILGMVNAILCFANDQSASVDRFMITLSVYKDKGLPFCGHNHCFEPYNEVYQKFIFATIVDGSYLRKGYDYKKRNEYLCKNMPWYNNIAKEYEKNAKEVKKESTQSDANRANMEESVLGKISASNLRAYYEGWRNGKHGSICQKEGIYRFVEMARGKSGMLDDVKRSEEDNPIVAIGIVAYWLQFNSRMDPVIKRLTKYNCEIPKDIREQFDNYTKIRFEQFRKEHRDDPNTLDWDWEYEFYVNTIIPHEIAFNKRTEALFDYISDSDIKLVQAVMKNYIKYLKKCRADKGYQVSPELLVLRAVDSQDDTKYEDLEDYEVKTILEKLKDEGYIDAMWVHGQKLPWVCKILDKGRAYLKQVEEGEGGISIAPVDTPQPSSEQVTTETPSQMTQPNDNSEFDQYVDNEEWDEDEDEDKVEVTPEVREYNTTYDYVFDPRVKPEEVKKALNNITTFDKYQHPFWFVFTKVLVHLQWIPTSTYTKDILKWASLQYDLHWTTKRQLSFSDIGGDKRDMNREANEGKQKKIKDTDITLWNTISKTEFRDIEKYRQFALLLKKTFVHFIVDGLEVKESTNFNLGKPLDRVKFMKSPKNLINSGK